MKLAGSGAPASAQRERALGRSCVEIFGGISFAVAAGIRHRKICIKLMQADSGPEKIRVAVSGEMRF